LRPFIREVDAAGRSIQQTHSMMALERCQDAHDGGKGRLQRIRGSGKAASIHDLDESLHGQKPIHAADITP